MSICRFADRHLEATGSVRAGTRTSGHVWRSRASFCHHFQRPIALAPRLSHCPSSHILHRIMSVVGCALTAVTGPQVCPAGGVCVNHPKYHLSKRSINGPELPPSYPYWRKTQPPPPMAVRCFRGGRVSDNCVRGVTCRVVPCACKRLVGMSRASWDALSALGASWGALDILGVLGRLGASWASWGVLGRIRGRIGASWGVMGASWASLASWTC